MAIDVLTSTRKRCPVCDTRRIKRSHRREEEKAAYPESKFFRCRKCETRFVHVKKSDVADQDRDEEATAADDTGIESGGPSELLYVGIFVLACVLTGLFVYVFGRG